MPVQVRLAAPSSVILDPVGKAVMPPGLQPGYCEFESRPDHHFPLGVAQSGQSTRFGTGKSSVRIGPPRPNSAGMTGVMGSESSARVKFTLALDLTPLSNNYPGRLAKLACLSGLNPVMSSWTWEFDPLSLRQTFNGGPDLTGRVPGCDPGQYRFETGGPPQ